MTSYLVSGALSGDCSEYGTDSESSRIKRNWVNRSGLWREEISIINSSLTLMADDQVIFSNMLWTRFCLPLGIGRTPLRNQIFSPKDFKIHSFPLGALKSLRFYLGGIFKAIP